MGEALPESRVDGGDGNRLGFVGRRLKELRGEMLGDLDSRESGEEGR